MHHVRRIVCLLLLTVAIPSASAAQAVPAVRLRGVVVDSVVGAPLANAMVRVFRAGSPADGLDVRTDTLGRFTVPTLSVGTWWLSFLHPRLDSLRLEPPLVRVEAVEEGQIDIVLAIPSGPTLARQLCGAPRGDSSAVMLGVVRDAAARLPIAGATIQVVWPEWVFAKEAMTRENMIRAARTDSTGHFVLCHVPQGSTVTAQASTGRDSTGVVEVEIPASGYAVVQFTVDRSSQLTTPAGESGSAPWRRGSGAIVGAVRAPDGRPLPGVMARVLGSGSAVRTDSGGTFRLMDAAAGTQTLEVRAVGFEPQRQLVELVPGVPLSRAFTLERSRVVLDTVRVATGRTLPADIQAIERRWRAGQGVILDGETVRTRTATQLTSALWGIPGVRLGTRAGYGNVVYLRGNRGQDCIPVVFLDGFRFIANGLSVDELVSPADVAAIEVYVRAMQRPAEFTDLADCGVFVVWTKRFLGNVPVMDPKRSR